ncbi:hypothetical protein Acsp03_58460 [Actinomadura sp. NBRC 104412]|uniref:hypothetical protein n=1 Tax=Actinomadura sp. NBRC 104412 TaxID=3032203 RepID=UPI0024A1D0C8|nr:hypothetical protein [Actinomadura sp. NBRC 104412]GLZ08380.1 hypothetical protein Acsp03_58460 [Actinomadura sp. NBRC 104412]
MPKRTLTMPPLIVRARGGTQPRDVDDVLGGTQRLSREALVAAGQALTWQWMFTHGRFTAIPLDRAVAVLLTDSGGGGPEGWHERFTRGLAHRVAGELTIAAVAAGLLSERSGEGDGADYADDAELLGSAIGGLFDVCTDLGEGGHGENPAERIVRDAARTHEALMGTPLRQRISVRWRDGFAVHTVRSVSGNLGRAALEEIRGRIGLPWPSRDGDQVGPDLGVVRWRAAMQARGEQMWCRLEGENALVTELWLRSPARSEPPGSDTRTPSA